MQTPSKLYLWEKRSLYLGVIGEPIRFVQPSSSIAFGLDKPIKLSWNGNEIETHSCLLPPGNMITGSTQGSPVAICMLDALGYDYATLSLLMRQTNSQVKFEIDNEHSYIEAFKALYYDDAPSETVYSRLDDLLANDILTNEPLTKSPNTKHAIDQRIVRVIELIHEHVEDNISTDRFAEEIGVSPSRLVQLFREQVGAPIRRYRLWHRLFCATQVIAQTQNLSAGAHAAGFADTAHFNRTFKRMIGMTPTHLLAQPNGLKIFTS